MNKSKAPLYSRILVALVASPSIALAIGHLAAWDTPLMEGARGFATIGYSLIAWPICALALFFIQQRQAQWAAIAIAVICGIFYLPKL